MTAPSLAGPARAALAAALLLLSGCFPVFSRVRTGALVPHERLQMLRDGHTTRREVLDRFGPPLVVVRLERAAVRVPEVGVRRSGGNEVPSAWFFDRFGGREEVGPHDVIYFYRQHELTTRGSGILMQGGVIGSSSDEDREDRLWVLVDGDTGLVKGHVHERDGPPPEPPAADGEAGR